MLKEVRNLKPGDQIRWAVEGQFEVIEVVAANEDGPWRVLVRQVDWGLETDEAGQAVITVDTERARVPFDGNIAELDTEIAELMRRRKTLKNRTGNSGTNAVAGSNGEQKDAEASARM